MDDIKRRVYLDNSATTYVSNEVLTEMLPLFTTIYGNSSSVHSFGAEANKLVETARKKIAKALCADPNEIVFTSGGTEANNLAIIGAAHANAGKGRHIITTQIEHDSVLEACKKLENEGFIVDYLPVDEFGMIKFVELLNALRPDTILISVMFANNEVGTIQSLKAIAKVANERKILMHTDAVAALSHIAIDVKSLGVDLCSVTAHKIYGPKGVGALYVKKGVAIEHQIVGGDQENGMRGGTLDSVGIVGFGKAIETAARDVSINSQKLKMIRDYFIETVKKRIPYIKINGHPQQKINSIVNISFDMIEGESIMLILDKSGIAVSTGSACNSLRLSPSHVLTAMGVSPEISQGSIRFSFGKNIMKEDVDYTIDVLEKAVAKLRDYSPIKKPRIK